jgi:hypothetical protein
MSNQPVTRLKKVFDEPRFGPVGRREPVVVPTDKRWQAHENRFGPSAALKAKEGPPVPHEVEFHVSPAPVELKAPLALAIGVVFALRNDRQVGGHERVSHTSEQGKTLLKTELVEIVEEKAANSPGFASMLEKKIFVAGELKPGVKSRAEREHGISGRAVPMDGILRKTVIGGQVKSAAEPECPFCWRSAFFRPKLSFTERWRTLDFWYSAFSRLCWIRLRPKEPHIRVTCWHVRIFRMNDDRHAQRLPRAAREFGAVAGGGGRELGAAHMRKGNARFFENGSFGKNPRAASAAFGARPGVLTKFRRSVFRLKRCANLVLEIEEVRFDRRGGRSSKIVQDQPD